MGRVHNWLGLTVGVILPDMRPEQRCEAYNCDITYATNNELGFDYLRDNMASSLEECVQRGHNFAIVDEVDSILIDEARTPLIISGPTQDEVKWYGEFSKIVARLVKDVDYEVDEKKRTISVLEPGITKVEDHLGIENLYEAANTPLISFLNNGIKAKELFRRDKEYVVMNGEVLIVDEHTGRILSGRRYNDGLHQAIEAKENVTVREEYQTLATVTLQNFFRLYDKLSGMTGTAMTEASEFDKIYQLGVVPIPTNRPMVRVDQPDLVYRTEEAKYEAVAEDIAEKHRTGQPILVGTVSVEKSDYLSALLKKKGVAHSVLNAKMHADEAKIVAMAGHKGAVTVATNMAGRGTDIMLGGNVEFLADAELRKQASSPPVRPRRPTTRPGPRRWRRSRRRSRPSTTRSRSSAASTCWAPSATSRDASTTSCAVVPAVRATRASPGSTSRCRTSSCGCSSPTGSTGCCRCCASPTTSRSRTSASPTPSPTRRARSRRRTSSPARTS